MECANLILLLFPVLRTGVTSEDSCWYHSSAQCALVAYIFFETSVRVQVREREDTFGRDLCHWLHSLEWRGPGERAVNRVTVGDIGLCLCNSGQQILRSDGYGARPQQVKTFHGERFQVSFFLCSLPLGVSDSLTH